MISHYYKEYSSQLGRDMEFKIYGIDGVLCLVIPCQDGRFYEWEDRGMFTLMEPLIDAGRIQFVTVDSVDPETWSSHGPTRQRMERLEQWNYYVLDELIPSALAKAGKPLDEPVMVMGASMGATHAANLFFRFPGRFNRMLALSGIYDMSPYIYDGAYDDLFYNNSPLAYLPNMDPSHEYVDRYNHAHAIFAVGQGSWENETKRDLSRLADVMYRKGIHIPSYFWGPETPHDWPSWEKQVSLYVPEMV